MRWTLEPIATIVGVSPNEPFGRIRGVALRADGRVAVVDAQARRVTMYDDDGVSMGQVGRDGSGPGEYRRPYSPAWLGDTLAVFDPEESRVVFFLDGRVPVGHAVAQRLTGSLMVRFYPVSTTKAYLLGSRGGGANSRSETVFIGYSGIRAADTVSFPRFDVAGSGATCNFPDGGITYFGWPESPKPFAIPARADGSTIVASSANYSVVVQSPSGDTVVNLTRVVDPLPVPDSLWTAGLDEYTKHVAAHGSGSCSASPKRPDHMSPLRAIAVAADGSLWITVRERHGDSFDVYSAEGNRLASIAAPPHVEDFPITIAADRVALVAEEPDGSQVVRLYRIVR